MEFDKDSHVAPRYPGNLLELCEELSIPSTRKDSGKVNEGTTCVVCGDVASGVHYNVYSCEGCRGFFKRASTSQELTSQCEIYGTCEITKTMRKCKFCRYRKCVAAGMRKGVTVTGRPRSSESGFVKKRRTLPQNLHNVETRNISVGTESKEQLGEVQANISENAEQVEIIEEHDSEHIEALKPIRSIKTVQELEENLFTIKDTLKRTVECLVCGGIAYKAHYGVNSCEGCRQFFKRAVRSRKKANYTCSFNGSCPIHRGGRNCKHCRLQKCLKVGMSSSRREKDSARLKDDNEENEKDSESVEEVGTEKKCVVCGAAAQKVHYGAVSCASCAQFFERTLKVGETADYKCAIDENCDITPESRSCKYCRHAKCIASGMRSQGKGRKESGLEESVLSVDATLAGQAEGGTIDEPQNGEEGSCDSEEKAGLEETGEQNPGKPGICAVCSAVARCKHYGVYSCEGCRGVFKRTLKRGGKPSNPCPGEKKCVIAKDTKNCTYCRYMKCLKVGMGRQVKGKGSPYKSYPDTKTEIGKTDNNKQEEKSASLQCAVCGAVPARKNYGAICCQQCSKFFIRSQRRSYKCRGKTDCAINHKSPQCTYCRFQKCIQVGMKTREQGNIQPEHKRKRNKGAGRQNKRKKLENDCETAETAEIPDADDDNGEDNGRGYFVEKANETIENFESNNESLENPETESVYLETEGGKNSSIQGQYGAGGGLVNDDVTGHSPDDMRDNDAQDIEDGLWYEIVQNGSGSRDEKELCGDESETVANLDAALMGIECPICSKTFTYAHDIEQHLITEHNAI